MSFPLTWSLEGEAPLCHSLSCLKLVCHRPCPGLAYPGTLLVLASLLGLLSLQNLCPAGSRSDSASPRTPVGNSFPLCWILALVHFIDVSYFLCSGNHPLFTEWALYKYWLNDELEDNDETNLCESRICVKSISSQFGNIGWLGARKQALTCIAWGSINRYNLCSRIINVRALGPSKIPPLGMVLFSMKWQMY